MRARFRLSAVGAAALLLVALLGGAQSAAALSGSPINIGSAPDPYQASVAVDAAGTAYIAWPVKSPPSNLGANGINWCTISVGATACTHSGQLLMSGGGGASAQGVSQNDITVLLDGSTVRIFVDVGSAAAFSDMPIQEWISTDGGASYQPVNAGQSVAYAQAGADPVGAVLMPGGGSIGMAFVGQYPQFSVFPDTASPPQCSDSTTCPFATIGTTPNIGPTIGSTNYATESGAQAGVMGLFQGAQSTGNLACSTSTNVIGYIFGSGNQVSGTNDYDIKPGSAGSAWKTAQPALVTCDAQYGALGGGPSGFGAAFDYQPPGGAATEVYRAFNPATMSWGPAATIAGHGGLWSWLSQDGSGGVYFTYKSSDDGSLELAYGANGGTSWVGPVVLNADTTDQAQVPVNAVGPNGQGWLVWFDGGSHAMFAQRFVKTDALPAAPTASKPPVITGTPKPGKTLKCSVGTWTGSPTSYTYQWFDDGTPIAGATGSTYKVTTLEEGTTLTCQVTAVNAGGSASATSRGVKVPVPFVAHCQGATGKLSAATLGLVTLGATRAREHFLYRKHSDRGKQYEDFFCLTPIGVRVGYGSPKLLKILTTAQRRALRNKVVWASTSNPFYSIGGVRPGEAIAAASAALHTEAPLHIGLNYWYLAVQAKSTAVLKVRGGVVQEIGIADNLLTANAADQNTLMHSFY